jgi:hypothetical protein
VRFYPESLVEKLADSHDFFFRYSYRTAVKAHEPDHSGNLQDAEAILKREVNKDVTRKQGQPETYFAVFPPAGRFILG